MFSFLGVFFVYCFVVFGGVGYGSFFKYRGFTVRCFKGRCGLLVEFSCE